MKKNVSDSRQEAERVYKKLGKKDGQKHLDQILCFVGGMNSKNLVEYWTKVNTYFNEKKI